MLYRYFDRFKTGVNDKDNFFKLLLEDLEQNNTAEVLPDYDSITTIEESELLQYIYKLLNSQDNTKQYYDDVKESDYFKRFRMAVERQFSVLAEENIAKNLLNNEHNLSTITGIGFNSVINNINNSLKIFAETLISHLDTYKNLATTLVSNIGPILAGLSDAIQSIQTPTYTEEEKKQLVYSFKKWGQYGWTTAPAMPVDLFDTCPASIEEADRVMLQYCKKDDINDLFCKLENICTRKKDLREAIKCYENGCYKACALILFSIIDSRMIRKASTVQSENHPTGMKAILSYKEKTKQIVNDDAYLYFLLMHKNLFTCLCAVFDDTNNFKKNTKVINRNYYDHGMTYRAVRKKDCIKLFLLLYNLLDFIDIIKEFN